jgi:DNA-binding response OmpR family regulator
MMVVVMSSSDTDDLIPVLRLLGHDVQLVPYGAEPRFEAPEHDVLLLDARNDLVRAHHVAQQLGEQDYVAPVLALLSDGGLPTVSPAWALADFLVDGAGPAEIQTRLSRAANRRDTAGILTRPGGLTLDENSLSVSIGTVTAKLTYLEFLVLEFLSACPDRVFSRRELMDAVWAGGATPNVAVVTGFIARIRRKLGPKGGRIATVRGVGYRFVSPNPEWAE